MKKKVNDSVTKKILQQELKKQDKKFDLKFLSFSGHIDDIIDNNQQHTEQLITDFKNTILQAVDGVMGELKTIRESQEIITGRVYENVDKLENYEARIISLEQVALAG
ncbi:hypothetical protein KKE48_03780 [Patescibacteria group bacterium]|nr:hypothetical protein [Patescibacteria group bacterium]MBU1499960.1 hypothetical protein [Patescibacteria group bacterium]